VKSGPAAAPVGLGNLASRLSPAAHRPAARQVVIHDSFPYDTAFRLAFVGTGQGGGRMAHAFWELGYRRVGTFNTTDQDSDGIDPKVPLLSLGTGGAMKDMQRARQALAGRDEEVWELFQRAWGNDLDYALICVGLGGGTGSGTALPLVRLARKYMESKGQTPRVGALVSLPSVDEGQTVCRNAVAAFRELLADRVSPLVVIDNDRVHSLYQPAMGELLPKSNFLVSRLLHLFNQLAACKSPYITFDRSELAQLLDGGVVVMGSADIPLDRVQGPADISTAIREQLAESVLAQVDLRTGRKAACVFVGSREVLHTFSKDFFAAGFTMLDRIVGSAYPEGDGRPTVIHRGIYPGDDDGLQCYTMISELDPPHDRLQELARKAGMLSGGLSVSSPARHLGVA
jgi:cell division GTPase FtsZ